MLDVIEVTKILASDGAIVAGKSERNGRVINVSASMLIRLARERRGLLQVSPDGGVMLRALPTTTVTE